MAHSPVNYFLANFIILPVSYQHVGLKHIPLSACLYALVYCERSILVCFTHKHSPQKWTNLGITE